MTTLAHHISRAGFIRNFVVWQEDGDTEAGRFTIGGGNVRYAACRDVLHVPEAAVTIRRKVEAMLTEEA